MLKSPQTHYWLRAKMPAMCCCGGHHFSRATVTCMSTMRVARCLRQLTPGLRVQEFLANLKAVSNDLDDIQRDILIQATFKVAAADGLIRVSPSFWHLVLRERYREECPTLPLTMSHI